VREVMLFRRGVLFCRGERATIVVHDRRCEGAAIAKAQPFSIEDDKAEAECSLKNERRAMVARGVDPG
jgi:hypothetical protein